MQLPWFFRISKALNPLWLASVVIACQEQASLELVKQNVVAFSHSADGSTLSFFDFSIGRQVSVNKHTEDTTIHTRGIGGNYGQLSFDGKYLAFIGREKNIVICDLEADSVVYAHADPTYRIAKPQWHPTRYSLIYTQGDASHAELHELFFMKDSSILIKRFSYGDARKHVSFSYNSSGELIAIDNPGENQWKMSIIQPDGKEIVSFEGMFFGWINDTDDFFVARNNQDQVLSVFRKSLMDPDVDQFISNAPGYYTWFNQTFKGKTGYLASEANSEVGKIDSTGVYTELHSGGNLSFDSRAAFSSNGYHYSKGVGNGINVFSVQLGENEKLDFNHFMRMGGHAFEPRLSPSEGKLLFQARAWDGDNQDSNGAHYIDLTTSEYHLIEQAEGYCESEGNCIEWVAWLSDEEIVYTLWRNPFPSRAVIRQNIYSGRKEILIDSTDHGVAHLEPSGNSKKIAFVKWALGSTDCSVMIYNIPKKELVEVSEIPDSQFSGYSQPAVYFSWGNDYNLFVAYTDQKQNKLKILDIDLGKGSNQVIFEMEDRIPTGLDYSSTSKELLLTHEEEHVIGYYEISL